MTSQFGGGGVEQIARPSTIPMSTPLSGHSHLLVRQSSGGMHETVISGGQKPSVQAMVGYLPSNILDAKEPIVK